MNGNFTQSPEILVIVMIDHLQDALKQEVIPKNLDRRNNEGRTICEEFTNDKVTMTTGNIFRINKIILDKNVLDLQTEIFDNNVRKYNEKRNNFIQTYAAKKAAHDTIIQLTVKLKPEDMTNAQLKAVISFKERKLDRTVPTTKKPLLERY